MIHARRIGVRFIKTKRHGETEKNLQRKQSKRTQHYSGEYSEQKWGKQMCKRARCAALGEKTQREFFFSKKDS